MDNIAQRFRAVRTSAGQSSAMANMQNEGSKLDLRISLPITAAGEQAKDLMPDLTTSTLGMWMFESRLIGFNTFVLY